MIIGGDRLPVIENIKNCTRALDLNAKVEVGDPTLTPTEAKQITDRYLEKRKSFGFRFKSFIAVAIANAAGYFLNRDTEYVGEVDKDALRGGAIITSNHFSPLENTVIRSFVRKNGVKKLSVVSQVTNFAMGGFVGFLMNYASTVPLGTSARYLTRDLLGILEERMQKGDAVLIYPEQEMWFNYRKPRPHKEGAYYFASKLNRPVISCFVEMVDKDELDTIDFYKVKYRLHVLGVIYPDEALSVKENSRRMCQADYELKVRAYERIYGKTLSYGFESSDIAGWIDYSWVLGDEE